MKITVSLNEDEKACALFLADQFDKGEKAVFIANLPGFDRLSMAGLEPIIDRFENRGWVSWESDRSLLLHGRLLADLEQLRNPEPEDYWKSISVWFKSRWWSVPTFVVLVTLPLLVQWVEMIETILKWLGLLD